MDIHCTTIRHQTKDKINRKTSRKTIQTKTIDRINSYAQLLKSILNLVLYFSTTYIVPGIKLINIFVNVFFSILEARMNFETSEKASHLTMQTLETKTKTDIIKQYSINVLQFLQDPKVRYRYINISKCLKKNSQEYILYCSQY